MCHILRTDSQSRCMDKNTVCGEKTHRRPTSRRVCVCDRRQTAEKNTNTHSASHLHRTPACFIFSGQIHNHTVWIKTLCVEKNTQKTNITTCVCDRRQTVEKNKQTHRRPTSRRVCVTDVKQWRRTNKHTEDQHHDVCV